MARCRDIGGVSEEMLPHDVHYDEQITWNATRMKYVVTVALTNAVSL